MQSSPIAQQIEQLEAIYTFRNPHEISTFLAAHPSLADMLLQAYPHIQFYFPDSPCFLEVRSGLGTPENPQLFLFIVTTQEPQIALTALQKFVDAWWVENKPRAQGHLVIDVEFQAA